MSTTGRSEPWTERRQTDWVHLPYAPVDWLVVWNVNLGHGGEWFSIENRYWGDRPFRPRAVAPEQAWVWCSYDEPEPTGWTEHERVGGILNLMAIRSRGMPGRAGTVLATRSDAGPSFDELARGATGLQAQQGGAWCPALVGHTDGDRPGISIQLRDRRPALDLAIRLGVRDVVIVDPFALRPAASWDDPHVLVIGTPEGTDRRWRGGQEAYAHVALPPWLEDRRYPYDRRA